MKDHPILFNTEMVKAVLSGQKTQTRRPFKVQPPDKTSNGTPYTSFQKTTLPITEGYDLTAYIDNSLYIGKCPFGQVGDRLWVRETFKGYGRGELPPKFYYRASDPDVWPHLKWTPSIHMPREASRINLEITDIRIERVQDITYIEAKAEGVNYERGSTDPRDVFRHLWNSIYKNWNDDPWVWVVEFKVIQEPFYGLREEVL